ncbi:hypothetical protein [Nocardia sp. GAS34]|uniref:hypothetical protein n=1 Tax=unclassified Nocardia TaxID=2637762 RepID=UPI003D21CC9F
MPHDSSPSEPVLVPLTMPAAARASLVDGLVRPVSADPGPVLDADAPDVRVIEFLVAAAHSAGGFVARTASGTRALSLIAATVAALCGEDIGRALTHPDLDFLRGLKPPAVEALRSVLLAIETDAVETVSATVEVLRPR